jgi:hypothetical protein
MHVESINELADLLFNLYFVPGSPYHESAVGVAAKAFPDYSY